MRYFVYVNRSSHDDKLEREVQAFFNDNPDIVMDEFKISDRGSNFHVCVIYHKESECPVRSKQIKREIRGLAATSELEIESEPEKKAKPRGKKN